MKNRSIILFLIISTVFTVHLTSCSYFKKQDLAITLGFKTEAQEPIRHRAVFIIFDGTGSGKYTYRVPRINVDLIADAITLISEDGEGELWLTYVDRSALNNEVLYYSIPKQYVPLKRPLRKTGERKGEYDKTIEKFIADSLEVATKHESTKNDENRKLERFLSSCQKMIDSQYAPKPRGEDYSDIIGALNAATRSLSSLTSEVFSSLSILLISDGEHDLPASDTSLELKPIPDDIFLVTVNNSGSDSSVVAGRSVEIDNIERALNLIINRHVNKLNL